MTASGHNPKPHHRAVRLPNYMVRPLSEIPPAERPKGWSCVNWEGVREALEAGKSVCFAIEPHELVAFWQHALFHLRRPIAARYIVRHHQFWIYPFTPDPRADRARANQSDDCGQPALMRAEADRVRLDATVRFIVADALEYAADGYRRGVGLVESYARFVAARGDGFYPLRFDAGTFDRWCDAMRQDPGLAKVLGNARSDE